MKLRESSATYWENSNEHHLDIRPILDAAEEPYSIIMDAIHQLNDKKNLIIHIYFEPLPLIKQLKQQNFSTMSTKIENDHWTLKVTRTDAT